MKAHASVGADILSSINFPYPVVPIVRHHHENWDGTGYPDGVRGTDIPIGARILAVVDCFDALTSDRPYRPRMKDADALSILAQRRGIMYDPLVIDTFMRTWQQLAAEAASSAEEPKQTRTSRQNAPVQIAAHPAEGAVRAAMASPLDRLLEAAIGKTGATLAVLFATDLDFDRLLVGSIADD